MTGSAILDIRVSQNSGIRILVKFIKTTIPVLKCCAANDLNSSSHSETSEVQTEIFLS